MSADRTMMKELLPRRFVQSQAPSRDQLRMENDWLRQNVLCPIDSSFSPVRVRLELEVEVSPRTATQISGGAARGGFGCATPMQSPAARMEIENKTDPDARMPNLPFLSTSEGGKIMRANDAWNTAVAATAAIVRRQLHLRQPREHPCKVVGMVPCIRRERTYVMNDASG